MIKLDKYLVCRWGITIAGLIAISAFVYLLPQLSKFFGYPNILTVIWFVIWGIMYVMIPVFINAIWDLATAKYIIRGIVGNFWEQVIWGIGICASLFYVISMGISVLVILSQECELEFYVYAQQIIPFGTPLLAIAGTNIFIAFFYEIVAKKSCKLIYKGGT